MSDRVRESWFAWWAAVVVSILVCGGAAALVVDQHRKEARLLAAFADELPADPSLLETARRIAEPAYAAHCAGCHGTAMEGDARHGVPSLRSGVWLYDFGRVSDIERTILYGIRSGYGKGRNTTDMPALGIEKRLSDGEIRDAAAYVISLSHPGGDPDAIARGERIYQGKGECFDCHGADASGNVDWGVPGFTDGVWLYGGDPETVYTSIHDGRHGRCPSWIGVLDPVTIRALAVYLHNVRDPK